MNNVAYSHDNFIKSDNSFFSYKPIPFYDGLAQSKSNISKKLDLNLYCIKRPLQTCFIRIVNPDLLTWGIEQGDILVVEKNDSLSIGDLVVLEINHTIELYEFFAHNNNEFIFFALSSKAENIKTHNWSTLPIIGTVTNTIHQIKSKNTVKFSA